MFARPGVSEKLKRTYVRAHAQTEICFLCYIGIATWIFREGVNLLSLRLLNLVARSGLAIVLRKACLAINAAEADPCLCWRAGYPQYCMAIAFSYIVKWP